MKYSLPVWLWIFIAVALVIFLGFIDWVTGYELNFFVFYFIPVSLAAWFVGLNAAVPLAVLSALVWGGVDILSGDPNALHFYAVWNTMIRLVSFLAIGGSVSKIRQLLDQERKLTEDLRRSMSEIKALEAFLPICSLCKKIRDQDGQWQQLEAYFSQHTDTKFSHGYCPECARKVMAEAGLIRK